MILNNCRLIGALSGGTTSEQGSVTVENGKITAVSAIPVTNTDEEVFDCQGKTLLPGLIDLHTHITLLGGVGVDGRHMVTKMSFRGTGAKVSRLRLYDYP